MDLEQYRLLQSWSNKFKENRNLDKYAVKMLDEFVEYLGVNLEFKNGSAYRSAYSHSNDEGFRKRADSKYSF